MHFRHKALSSSITVIKFVKKAVILHVYVSFEVIQEAWCCCVTSLSYLNLIQSSTPLPLLTLYLCFRLTPALGFMILFYACLSLYMYNSPFKPTYTTIADSNCVDNWWSTLLYVNNVIHPVKEVSCH